MNKRIIRILCLLLVTATCVSICPAFKPITAYALEYKKGDINGDGDITTKKVVLEPGCKFSGKCSMITE